MSAILFDLDDTLCDDTGQMISAIERVALRAGEQFPVAVDAIVEAYWKISHHFWTYEISLTTPDPLVLTRTKLWEWTLAALGVTVSEEILGALVAYYGELREETPPLFPGALDTLQRLRDSGHALGIVTNGLSETHLGKIQRLQIGSYFDVILMPDLTGFAKPDPRQFHLACKRLGHAPESVVHVGDSLASDVGGAVAAGLTAVWFNPNGRSHDASHPKPHHTVQALPELVDLQLGK